jgi:dTDP-4-amino-4,6-dideoxygalactose transaminase
MIRSAWPRFAEDEIEAATAVLRSGRVNYWTGEEGRAFEREFARACGVGYGVALANGTVALELALRVLDIGPGDEVVVSPRSFMASAACVVAVGATPVFADVDADSGNLAATTVEPVVSGRTRAVICVHLAGWPCEMGPILELARRRGLYVIEDCAQAHGARYMGRPVGSLGDVAAFSFCQDKIITTAGEGGMLVTDDRRLWARAWSYKDHGKGIASLDGHAHPPGFRWLHDGFGTNWRMTEVQAAIGRRQLRKLPEWLAARRRNTTILEAELAGLDALRVPRPGPGIEHARYKHYAFLRPERLRPGWQRDRILAVIAARGAPALSGTCPEIYREKAFRDAGLGPAAPLPVAQELGRTSLMLPVDPTLDAATVRAMGEIVRGVVAEASAGGQGALAQAASDRPEPWP